MDLAKWLQEIRAWAGDWPKQAGQWFEANYGLNPEFALKVALLYLALWAAGLNPRVTSGWRDPSHVRDLQRQWDSGDHRGLKVRPNDPEKSKHSRTNMWGGPDARAVDIQCSDSKLAADIGRAIGLEAGYYYRTSDPGHFETV